MSDNKELIERLRGSPASNIMAANEAATALEAADRKIAELESNNDFDGKRLRRLAVLCGVSIPESEEAIVGCAGTIIGQCIRAIEQSFAQGNTRIASLEAERDALAAQVEGARVLMADVNEKYFALLKEKEADAEKFKAEGDMYGWNFHTGMRGGAIEMHLNMTKLIKALSTLTHPAAAVARIEARALLEGASVCDNCDASWAVTAWNSATKHCAAELRKLAEQKKEMADRLCPSVSHA